MRQFIVCLTSALCLLVSACAGIQVDTDYDPQYDFSEFRNYAWYDKVSADNQIVEELIRGAVDATLKAYGYTGVEPNREPDFLVSFSAVAETAIRTDTLSTSMGYGRRTWGMGISTASRMREYTRGTLIIDVIEPGSKNLLWRGVSSAAVEMESSADEKSQLIDEVVKAMLKKFPPGAR